MPTPALARLEPVDARDRAEILLHPLRQRILQEARKPRSAAEIARRIDQTPQKVNYHVRTLADAGFLVPAGEGRKRNLVEKRYQATAQSYVLLPDVLGDLQPSALSDGDQFSARTLLHLFSLAQQELGRSLTPASGTETDRLPTLSMEAELRFDSAEQRARFAAALQHTMTNLIREHAAAARGDDGTPRSGRPYRLVVGCYPAGLDSPRSSSSSPPERTTS